MAVVNVGARGAAAYGTQAAAAAEAVKNVHGGPGYAPAFGFAQQAHGAAGVVDVAEEGAGQREVVGDGC